MAIPPFPQIKEKDMGDGALPKCHSVVPFFEASNANDYRIHV